MKIYHKRYIYLSVLGFVGLFFATGCIDEMHQLNFDSETSKSPYIELSLQTRSESDEVINFTDQEKKMNTVDLFFYPTDANENTTPPVKVFSTTDKKHTDKVTVQLSNEEIKSLFGIDDPQNSTETAKCKVYAVINVTSSGGVYENVAQKDDDGKYIMDVDGNLELTSVNKTSATISDLKMIKASSPEFATEFQEFAMFTKNPDGDEVTFAPAGTNSDEKKITGEVKVKNLAAKIDVFVNFGNVKGVNPNGDNKEVKEWKVVTNIVDDVENPTSELHLLNGVTTVLLNGFDKDAISEPDYYSIRFDAEDDYRRGFAASGESDKNDFPWVSSHPYYTYPNSWADSPLEQHRTSMLLKVDWVPIDDASGRNEITTYYSVPINLEDNKLESNKYYRLKLNINTLGGQNFGEPLEIEGNWEVMDWSQVTLLGDIREVRYLEVDQIQRDIDGKEFTAVINGNTGLVSIPFKTSHAVEIESFSIKYTSYQDYTNTGTNRNEKITDPGTPKELNNPKVDAFTKTYEELMNNNYHCAYIDNVNHMITVKHNIGATTPNNATNPSYYYPNTSEQYLYYTYYITIKLKHEDDTRDFGKASEITIIHHPAIYVSGETNEGYNFTWSFLARADASQDRTADASILNAANIYGWTRVNNNSYNNAGYGGLSGLQKMFELTDIGSNKSNSPVMYIVTVSQLDGTLKVGNTDIQFHIRDPRTTQPDLLQSSGWANGPHYVNGEFEKLSNGNVKTDHNLNNGNGFYYPTNDSQQEEYMNALSPRYRIASSFGNPQQDITTLENAKKRCASYCEAGYPAGRWRLPTYGELAFVSYLSKKELIPPLFGGRVLFWSVDASYWTAQGLYKVDDDGNINPSSVTILGSEYVRCVYDDWYWVKDDGTPDKIEDPYNALSSHTIFVWGDKKKNNPQDKSDID